MKLRQFICNPEGEISQSKVWTNIAFAIGSFVVVKLSLVDSPNLPEIFLWYLVIVSGSELGKKFMTMKLSNNQTKE